MTTSNAQKFLSYSHTRQSRLMAILNCWKSLKTQRQTLRGFKPHLLNDIGISQQQAFASSKNPFWM